ncbi:hypothetical protein [Citrobacter portucalensis]|uniref:hypothetical protein n=1 Tax=Citrobacter portucalensis TaxID=1639133 RepID=UPI00226B9D5C|nr:hypothetical protein [Citrobacter portucalensis]MCX8984453.1 hypothetical protein [Citrobacter portucalensis]
MFKLVIASLVGAVIYTTSAHAASPPATDYRQIAYCIEAGRDNGDTDKEITDRCVPSGDTLDDYE